MPGKAKAVTSGHELCDQVADVARALGLDVRREVRVARRLWGAIREIDVIVSDQTTKRSLGIECKYQGGSGSAEEKIPATVQDIAAWPIPGIVVFEGNGFSKNMRAYLYSTGKAVELCDLRDWLMLFFAKTP